MRVVGEATYQQLVQPSHSPITPIRTFKVSQEGQAILWLIMVTINLISVFRYFIKKESKWQPVDRSKFCNFRKYKSKFKLKNFQQEIPVFSTHHHHAWGSTTKSLCTEGKWVVRGERGGGGKLSLISFLASKPKFNSHCSPQPANTNVCPLVQKLKTWISLRVVRQREREVPL